MQSISKDEQKIIDLIREKDFQNITIQVTDGRIILIRQELTIKPNQNEEK